MKPSAPKNGFTLIEMSIVLMLILALAGLGLYVSSAYRTWQLGRAASEELHTVYVAQRMFLADNPTTAVSSITAAQIIPYLAGNATALPTAKSLDGNTLTVDITKSPPVLLEGSTVYDPSGSSTDSLWDAGL